MKEMRNADKILVVKPEGKRRLGTCRNTVMNWILREIVCEDV
jgi:hypothetical protein